MTRDEMLEKLRSAGMSGKQAHCLARRVFNEWAEQDIADELFITQQAVHGHIEKAKARLAAVGIEMPAVPERGPRWRAVPTEPRHLDTSTKIVAVA